MKKKHCVFILLLCILQTMSGKAQESFLLKIKPGFVSEVRKQIKSQNPEPELHKIFKSLKKPSPGLDHYYKLRINGNPMTLLKWLARSPGIEFIERVKRYQPLVIPDDPGFGSQWHLAAISAPQAWDLIPGSPNSIITAIIDTGFDLSHEDLANNIFTNENDPVDGLDNDGDGYVDNYYGWDFGDNDNDPSSLTEIHGTIVSGAGFASTNNTTGIAGTSFNSKFMPLKIHSTTLNELVNGYEAIIYAVEHGATVINLSWGEAGEYSQFEQDVINYAALEYDAVVVAAAGNTNDHLTFYPASYDNVLSVSSTNESDQKTSWATFSEFIDVSAPGINIFTTQPSNGYANSWGSSLASPLVSGLAALVRHSFPGLNSCQIIEKIRVASDDLYSVNGNEDFFGLLGKGRLNMQKALQPNPGPSIRALVQPGYLQPFYGDSLQFQVTFKNFLDPITSSLSITLNTLSSNITMNPQPVVINSLNTLETSPVYSFSVKLSESIPPSTFLQLYFTFESGAYSDFQMLPFRNGADNIEFNNEKISWTANSKGHLGYFNDYSEGHSLQFQGIDYGWHAGLIAATDASHVSSTAANDFSNFTQDDDFISIRPVKSYPSPVSDIDYRLRVEENPSSSSIGIRIDERLLGWRTSGDQEFMIIQYRVSNLNSSPANNLRVGIFLDMDLEDYTQNKTAFSAENKMGYIYSANEAFGMALLTDQEPISRGVDFGDYNGNSADLGITFGDLEKFQFLSDGLTITDAGTSGSGNDVAIVSGGLIPVINSNESITLAFALVFGSSLADLESKADLAASKYNSYVQYHPLLEVFETCPGSATTINPEGLEDFELYSDPFHSNLLYTGNEFIASELQNPQTYYLTSLENGLEDELYRIEVDLNYVNADFTMSSDAAVINPGSKSSIILSDITPESAFRTWDFGNGYGSTNADAVADYFEPGNYTVTLTVIDNFGCEASVTKQVSITESYEKPSFPESIIVCYGEIISFYDQGKFLNLYTDTELSPVESGTAISAGPITSDTIFYVTQAGTMPESLPSTVKLIIEKVLTGFDYFVDTTSYDSPTVLNLVSSTPGYSSEWFSDTNYLGAGPVQLADYAGASELAITQRSISELGCIDSLKKVIPLKPSPPPLNKSITVCDNGSVLLMPEPGSTFVFYGGYNEIIHKGRFLAVNSLDRDTTFYVTSIDSLLESSPAMADIRISRPNAGFEPFNDTLLINTLNEIKFQPKDPTLPGYNWEFGPAGFSSATTPVVNFVVPGLYPVALSVVDSLGCSSSTEGYLMILDITAIGEENNPFMPFPNPVRNNRFRIHGVPEDHRIEVMDLTGKLIDFQSRQWNLEREILLNENVPNGIYLVRIISPEKESTFRIRIEN